MTGTHRVYHRRKNKNNAARLGLAAALAGVLAVGAVAVGVVLFRPDAAGPARPDVDAGASAPGEG
ncbi:MAG: hypothetical protein ACRDOO_04345, partial [Actinomadura sp.]